MDTFFSEWKNVKICKSVEGKQRMIDIASAISINVCSDQMISRHSFYVYKLLFYLYPVYQNHVRWTFLVINPDCARHWEVYQHLSTLTFKHWFRNSGKNSLFNCRHDSSFHKQLLIISHQIQFFATLPFQEFVFCFQIGPTPKIRFSLDFLPIFFCIQ